jgi:ferredoxin
MVSVTIDRDGCISCGACWSSCPEVYVENEDDGLSSIQPEYQTNGDLGEGEVPDELGDCATDGADSCPVEVIHVG